MVGYSSFADLGRSLQSGRRRDRSRRKHLRRAVGGLRLPTHSPLASEVHRSGHERTSTSGQVGSSDGGIGRSRPYIPCPSGGIEEAKAQSQARPVEERIASSKVFIERAKKRIGICQEEVARAQQVLSKAQAKLQSEEQGLAEGEARLADLIAESERSREERVPPTMPANFARELAELRACVQELREENSDLRSKLQSGVGGGEERERKQARNLSNSTLDLVPLHRICADHPGHGACQSQPMLHGGGRADASSRMETMIDSADARLRSNRFNPLSG